MRKLKNPSNQVAEKIKRSAPRDNGPRDGEQAIKATFLKFETGFMTKDIEAVADCLSPAFEWCPPDGLRFTGKDAALAEMARRFEMPKGPKFSRSRIRIFGNTVVQTYRVSFKGSDGKRHKVKALDVYKFRDGLLMRKDAYWKAPQ